MDISFPNKQLCTAADFCMLIRVSLKTAKLKFDVSEQSQKDPEYHGAMEAFDRADELWQMASSTLQHTFVARNGTLGYNLYVWRMEASWASSSYQKAYESASKVIRCFNDPELQPQVMNFP